MNTVIDFSLFDLPQKPNYVNPDQLVTAIYGNGIFFGALATIAVAIRTGYKIRTLGIKRVTAEDWIIVVSWVLSVFLVVCACLATKQGLGLHYWDIPPKTWLVKLPLPPVYAGVITYTVVVALIKIAILLFYLRLSVSRWFRVSVYCTMAFVIAALVGTLPPVIFGCSPIEANWDYSVGRLGEAKCIDTVALLVVSSALHFLGDVIIFALPLPVVFLSMMPWRKKIQVAGLFSMGLLLVAASVVRLHTMVVTRGMIKDYSWHGAYIAVWSCVEVSMGLVVACVPSMKIVFTRLFYRIFPPNQTTSSYKMYNSKYRNPHTDRSIFSGTGIGGHYSTTCQTRNGMESESTTVLELNLGDIRKDVEFTIDIVEGADLDAERAHGEGRMENRQVL